MNWATLLLLLRTDFVIFVPSDGVPKISFKTSGEIQQRLPKRMLSFLADLLIIFSCLQCLYFRPFLQTNWRISRLFLISNRSHSEKRSNDGQPSRQVPGKFRQASISILVARRCLDRQKEHLQKPGRWRTGRCHVWSCVAGNFSQECLEEPSLPQFVGKITREDYYSPPTSRTIICGWWVEGYWPALPRGQSRSPFFLNILGLTTRGLESIEKTRSCLYSSSTSTSGPQEHKGSSENSLGNACLAERLSVGALPASSTWTSACALWRCEERKRDRDCVDETLSE